jgi:hypothetical protein
MRSRVAVIGRSVAGIEPDVRIARIRLSDKSSRLHPRHVVPKPDEPDVRIARIRLSDKSSRLHPRHVVPKPAQAYEPKVPSAHQRGGF